MIRVKENDSKIQNTFKLLEIECKICPNTCCPIAKRFRGQFPRLSGLLLSSRRVFNVICRVCESGKGIQMLIFPYLPKWDQCFLEQGTFHRFLWPFGISSDSVKEVKK